MSTSQPLVYIVDDSADYRFLVGQVFKRFLTQYMVHFFESGAALVNQLQTGETEIPRLVLIDGHMPEMSGIETITQLRQQAQWENIPVVMVSSSTLASDQQQAYASGANFYMVKPTDFAALKSELDGLCHHWVNLEST